MRFLGAIYGKLPCVLMMLVSPRASGVYVFIHLWLTLTIICIRFGIPRMDVFLFRQVSPAPCSPPLGGSDAGSAVRFTPAESRAGAKTGRPAAKLDV